MFIKPRKRFRGEGREMQKEYKVGDRLYFDMLEDADKLSDHLCSLKYGVMQWFDSKEHKYVVEVTELP